MSVDFEEKKIPRTMATQHPDNARVPAWCDGEVIDGDAEIYEAYFAYATLGCQEVMWDSEGKDVDTRVVRKLLNRNMAFFREHTLGEDVFLTYRIPNPKLEVVERKIVVETLQNIAVAYDVASSFYNRDVAPIFEVILPLTTDSKELLMLCNYYKKSIAADGDIMLDDSTKVEDWIGTFRPKSINVIPLIEDFDSLLAIDRIVKPYIRAVKPRRFRVFIARSDPALNYGLVCAVLLSKIALSKLRKTEQELGAKINPIIGVGSKPFRGHLSPENVDNFLNEYRGLATVTIQSALRYDYPLDEVTKCIKNLNEKLPNGEADVIEPHEEEILRGVLQKFRRQYESTIECLAPFVNSVAAYVPPRRARKLHIGLFGYSRCVAGVCLPRAITFAAALYSIGLPPEFVGMNALTLLDDEELPLLKKYYVNMAHDLSFVGGYVSWENINMLMDMLEKTAEKASMNPGQLKAALSKVTEDLQSVEGTLGIKLGPRTLSQRKHENFTNNFLISYLEHQNEEAKKAIIEAAKLRSCLG
ncbi:MAG: phosphoenolpyruvate carboxylase [Candidatus Bathyarchaeota archaeon]|nr:phosphoenolpyruvate carboxylase [Candidatus Bathyarchaeota archaeon]